jgi:hypothetical protein
MTMRTRALFFTARLLTALGISSLLIGGVPASAAAQGAAPLGPPADLSTLKNFLPLEKPANLKPSPVVDLAGVWLASPYQSISMMDRGGARRGKEGDIDYKPWALAKTLSEVPPTGPEAEPHRTTDPWTRYCEPNGPLRAYAHPTRTTFVQFPDRILMLHELMQTFRIVRLNGTHPPFEDLDPTSWGDSIGWYENGDTLVIDTIGLNGRAWLDQMGHPMTEKAHIIERYTRMDQNTLVVQRTIDDPGAYNKPIVHSLNLRISPVAFMQVPWNCSVRDNEYYTRTLLTDAVTPAK